jgi:DNA-binding NarL/FixJ family response regulator
MVRIFIADDHAIVREGLKQIIAEISDMVVVDEASNGHEAISKVLKNNYDIIVLDISMPGISGLDVLKQIKSIKPLIPIMILSMHPEEQYAIRVFRAGAHGYLTKESAADELITAIRKVVSGGKYVSSSLAEKLAFDLEIGGEKPLHENLSDREYQVLCMIASGGTVKEIAEEISLSVKTVSTHRSHILDKMQMHNNAELIHYAIKNSLIE